MQYCEFYIKNMKLIKKM